MTKCMGQNLKSLRKQSETKKQTNKNPLLINKDAWESVASKISAFFNCIHLGKQKAQDLQI